MGLGSGEKNECLSDCEISAVCAYKLHCSEIYSIVRIVCGFM